MTRRVITFERSPHITRQLAVAHRAADPPRAPGGYRTAIAVGAVATPIVGATTAPVGWVTAASAVLSLVLLAPLFGSGAPWGLLATLSLALLLVSPRDQLGAGGPALIVAALMCTVLWLANRDSERPSRGCDADDQPAPGSIARAAQVRQGDLGERLVTDQLAHLLPDEYVLISGLTLPRGSGDIDHLVIGPNGIFVIETKTMAGRIVCGDDGLWRRMRVSRGGTVYPAYIGDPAAQVQRNIFAVRQVGQTALPHLFGPHGVWIEGLVVFAHPRSVLETTGSKIPAVLLADLAPRIGAHQPRRALSAADVDAVVTALTSARSEIGRPTVPPAQSAQTAQALVELALALPVVVALVCGAIGLGRVVTTQLGLIGLAHDVARVGALAASPSDAVARMTNRMVTLAPGLGIDPSATELDYDTSAFSSPVSPRIVATVRYRVDLGDLPLIGWMGAPVLRAQHVEWMDRFRSGVPTQIASDH